MQQLPRFVLNGKDYVADLRLGEFRGVHDLARITFDSLEGQDACALTGIVSCRHCNRHVIMSRVSQGRLLCTCGSVLGDADPSW